MVRVVLLFVLVGLALASEGKIFDVNIGMTFNSCFTAY